MGRIVEFKVCEPTEKYNVDTPHDKLFKDLLSDENELKEFVTKYVGINILEEQLEKSNTEYITNNYQNYQSDVAYKIKGKEVYILIEHQSTIDKNMPYRMLNYYVQKTEEIESKRGEKVYPLIIPIVLYTGERNWNVPTKYSETIEKYKTKNKYIELEYELVDINNYEEEELLEKDTMISYAMLIEKNKGKYSLMEILQKISNNCKTNKNREKMRRIINYILEPILQEDKDKMIEKFKNIEEEKVDMKTAQDYIREEIQEIKRKSREEGKREGIEKGMEKGREEGGRQIIINMIKNKVELSKIKQYTGIDEKEIQKIAANM